MIKLVNTLLKSQIIKIKANNFHKNAAWPIVQCKRSFGLSHNLSRIMWQRDKPKKRLYWSLIVLLNNQIASIEHVICDFSQIESRNKYHIMQSLYAAFFCRNQAQICEPLLHLKFYVSIRKKSETVHMMSI